MHLSFFFPCVCLFCLFIRLSSAVPFDRDRALARARWRANILRPRTRWQRLREAGGRLWRRARDRMINIGGQIRRAAWNAWERRDNLLGNDMLMQRIGLNVGALQVWNAARYALNKTRRNQLYRIADNPGLLGTNEIPFLGGGGMNLSQAYQKRRKRRAATQSNDGGTIGF